MWESHAVCVDGKPMLVVLENSCSIDFVEPRPPLRNQAPLIILILTHMTAFSHSRLTRP
eukprot:m.301322 g.301322  ORF g.301322 m.301322 type:complete len:59 (+) comp14714_c0_seq1:386-562(+)